MKHYHVLGSICITLAIMLTVIFSPRSVYADDINFTYSVSENGIWVTGYSGDYSYITIPKEIDGHSVVGISNGAFASKQSLTGIVLPEGVSAIGDNAFSSCTSLSSIRFMGDAPSVGTGAFSNCPSNLKIYYDPAKSGFGNPWNGYATEASIAVTDITLDKTSTALAVGQSLNLVPTINPSNAGNKNIIWTSSDLGIAKVDAFGTILAISEGNVVITATTQEGGYTASCSISIYPLQTAPSGEYGVPTNYDAIKLFWYESAEAAGYEVYRSEVQSGKYSKVADVTTTEFSDKGLKIGKVYYYKLRSYQLMNEAAVFSEFTQPVTVKTLDKSIGSTLFLYLSSADNRNSVFKRAVSIHYGDPHNTCAITVSEAFRRIGIEMPISTIRTNHVESQLIARGYKREMNLKLLQPGDICFTTDIYGNLLGGHSTHTFTFMGWANKEKTLMNIFDNQVYTYGNLLHTRTIFSSSITSATAFFYHTNLTDVGSILKASNLRINSSGYNYVKLSWTGAPGAYGYQVYRATSKYGTYTKRATVKGTSFTDYSVTAGKTYYYKIRAYSNTGTSTIYGNYTPVCSSNPKLNAPSVYAGTSLKGQIKLTWNGVSGASGYQVYRATSKNGTYYRVNTTSRTSYTNTKLISKKTYYYKVRAYKSIGKSKIYSKYTYVQLTAR